MALEHDRQPVSGHEHLFLPLGERNHGDAWHTVGGVDGLERCGELAFAAVDHDQVRQRGEALVIASGLTRIAKAGNRRATTWASDAEIVLTSSSPLTENVR